MIVFIGDLHGQFMVLPEILKNVPRDAQLIQVGDFGYWPGPKGQSLYEVTWTKVWREMGFFKPLMWIDGNHEYHPHLTDITEPTQLWPGAMYIPRGTVLTIDGKKVGFMGGAASIDYKRRTPGMNWFPEELPTPEQINAMIEQHDHVDVLVTHSPPRSLIDIYFNNPTIKLEWGVGLNWFDPTAQMIETLWQHFNEPKLFSGHFHAHKVYKTCTVLDINEVCELR